MISSVSGMSSGMASMQSMRKMGPPPDPQEKFNEMDVNGDGSLGLEELGEMAGHISEMTGESVSAEGLLEKLDTDGNGTLEMSEMPEPPAPPEGGFQGPPPFMDADGSIKPMDEQGASLTGATVNLQEYLLAGQEEETSTGLALLV